MLPLDNRVLIKPITKEKTSSGIYLPANEYPIAEGTVVAVNHANKLGISKDDVVMFQKFSGESIMFNQTEHLLVNEHDILAVVD